MFNRDFLAVPLTTMLNMLVAVVTIGDSALVIHVCLICQADIVQMPSLSGRLLMQRIRGYTE